MSTIRSKIATAIIVSSLLALIITYLIINFTISKQYDVYLSKNQKIRDESVVQVFKDDYIKNNKVWTPDAGTSLIKKALASGYSLKLEDKSGNLIWEVDEETIIDELNARNNKKAIISSQQFDIKRYVINVDSQIVGYVTIGQYTPLILSKEDETFIFNLTISILVSAVLGIIIILIISLYLSKQLSEPIKSISSTSYMLSMGNLKVRENLDTDILEIEKLRQSINLLGEKLDKQDILRKRLISDISHELRNPLNVLQTNLEAMIDGVIPLTPSKLSSLNNEVIRFGKLIGNLNVLREFESEKLETEFKEVNLKALCQDIFNNFHGTAQDKDLIMTYEYYKRENYIVFGDYHSLYQVVINLLHNAFKFTPPKGRVRISLRKDKIFTYLSIQDTGSGIPEEDVANIFERFYRVDKSREQVEGSGIGLTIVKNILDRHNATISVESKENVGTTFIIRFNNATKRKKIEPIRLSANNKPLENLNDIE